MLLYAGDSLSDETYHPELVRYTQLIDQNMPGLEPNYAWSFLNQAHGGWATHEWPTLPGYGYLPSAINTQVLNQDAEIITVLLGVNDHTIDDGTTQPRISLADYTTYLGQIVDLIRGVNNGSGWNDNQAQIVLITPPPIKTTNNTNGTTCHDNARLKTYADAVQQVATAKGTGFVDIYTPLWNAAGQNETTYTNEYTIGDGTHLNDAGHSFIYPLIRDAVINAINTAVQPKAPGTSIYGTTYGSDYGGTQDPSVSLSASLPISLGLSASLTLQTATAVQLSAALPLSAGLIASLSPVQLPSTDTSGTTQPTTIGPSPEVMVSGNVDYDTLNRVYRLFTTPAGSVPFDRNFGVDLTVLDNAPAALEGALLVEYAKKLNMYYPELTISQLSFSYQDSE